MHDVAHRGVSLDTAMDGRVGRVPEGDRALFRELCFGALRWYWRCKGVVDQLVDRPLRKRDRIVEALLVVGVYQLDQMRLPAHAALHTTVEACKAIGRPGAKGLVNGVLRNFQRRGGILIEALGDDARNAHPAWLWKAIHAQWPEQAAGIIDANNQRPPMALRVNTRAISLSAYMEALDKAGIRGDPVPHLPGGIVLTRGVDVGELPGFERGWVSVQDTSAQLLPALVAGEPRRILDACAAPGGKLTHLLETFPDSEAVAVEADAGRAGRIRDNLERLRLEAAITVADAVDTQTWWDGRPFDLVVLDVPCSGSGVIRRHPDIKVLRRASDIEQFAVVQQRLMESLWHTVAPGGLMIYVTCSILGEENQQRVGRFLERASGCREETVNLPAGAALSHGWQVLPGRDAGDGFFFAPLRKD